MDGQLAAAAHWVGSAGTVTVLSGAGISTESGIPDFRGPQGVWTTDPSAAALSTLDTYLCDPDVRRRAWLARRDHPAWRAEPGAGHQAIVDLERAGKLHAVISQNIDELHQRAGNDPSKVIEVHGTMFLVQCLDCELRTPMSEALERVAAGADDPACLACGGIQKSATISFGQALEPRVLDAAVEAARACDLLLAVGTTLTVHPVAGLCVEAVEAGARLVIVNNAETPYDRLADAVVREPIGEALPQMVRSSSV